VILYEIFSTADLGSSSKYLSENLKEEENLEGVNVKNKIKINKIKFFKNKKKN